MFTPQQIEQIAFRNATFGGYDMRSVDEILEPLTEDYITLYKENALLKSKMRILVSKLEEYRNNEASMKDAIINAQKTCDLMVKEAERKCAAMLSEANEAAARNEDTTKAILAAEEARVEEARRVATDKITEIEAQFRSCLEALSAIKTGCVPTKVKSDTQRLSAETKLVAEEISQNLAAMMGEAQEQAPKPEPKHPTEAATTKFTGLKFGPNYDPRK
jgi:cell division initiation protein